MSLTKEDILSKISSYDILNYYLQPFHDKGPKLRYRVNIQNPLLPFPQAVPTFNIYNPNDSSEWIYEDLTFGDSGCCFSFVMKLYNIDLPSALLIIENNIKEIQNSNKKSLLAEPLKADEETLPFASSTIDELKKSISLEDSPWVNPFVKSFHHLACQGASLHSLKKIFGNFILEQSTVLFPSERGVGKTYFMLQLAIAIANGDTHFCGELLELHGNVLYINLELGERIVKQRLEKLYSSYPTNQASPYQAYCISFRNSLKDNKDEIENAIQTYKPVLIIIDNLRSAFSNNDNEKNKEMAKIFMGLNVLKDQYDFSFVIVHHTKKGSSNKLTDSDMQSGAGAITDLVDADFFLRKSKQGKDLRILKRMKSRECEEQDGAKLIRFNPDTLWFELVEDDVAEKEHIFEEFKSKEEQKNIALLMKDQGKSNKEIADVLGVNKSTVGRRFNNAN